MAFPRSLPWLVLGGFACVALLAILVAAGTSTVAFGAYNLDWDGTSELRDEADASGDLEVLLDAEGYDDTAPDETVAIVLRPAASYDRQDRERLARFVADGGTLIVADNFGPHGDELLAATGAEARFDGRLLRDEEHYHAEPAMPVATNVTADGPDAADIDPAHQRLARDVDRLTLNYGTAVEPNGADALVRTSSVAYLDAEGDGDFDPDEEDLRSYPVVTAESVGNGTVVAVGDPSVFINAMIDEPDNRQFVRNVVGADSTVVLDVSHAGGLPPLAVALLLVRDSALLGAAVGLVAVLLAVAAANRAGQVRRLARRYLRGELSTLQAPAGRSVDAARDVDEAVVARVLEDHAEWDEERLRRVIRTIEVGRRSNEDDE